MILGKNILLLNTRQILKPNLISYNILNDIIYQEAF